MIRLLIWGSPGTPIFEVGERISGFHGLDFFTIEREPEDVDSYFDDKIPERTLDTGDMTSGSESQRMVRNPKTMDIEKHIDKVDPDVAYEVDPLSREEKYELFKVRQGVIVTEIPGPFLLRWANRVVFLESDADNAIKWFRKRRKCMTCGSVFHLEEKPPLVPGICDRCGTDLKRKPEDSPRAVRDQYRNWRNDFWRFKEEASTSGCFCRISVDDRGTLEEIIREIDRDASPLVEKEPQYF